MQRKLYSLITGLFIGLVSSGGTVSAATCDLTTAGSSCTVNGAIFQQIDPQSTGTGVINSFVEIGGNTDTVSAYNTTVNNVLNNGSSDQINHALSKTELTPQALLLVGAGLVVVGAVSRKRLRR